MKARIRGKYVLELDEKEAAHIYEALINFRSEVSEKGGQKNTDIFLGISNILDKMPLEWPNY